ncbi:MAG TPA: phosphoribosylformylglycinamidine synthase subunit PurS [Trueperaceae bacterium]
MPEYRAVVEVMLKRSILDPQGRTVETTLKRLGHDNISDLRVGKRIEMKLSGEREALEKQLDEVARKTLANPVLEDVTFELIELDSQ